MSERGHNEWFAEWFDSPYYHILYRDRDQCEADAFLDRLVTVLHPEPGARFLDLACGKGRHSIYLNKKGFDVTGVDLSAESIALASAMENEHLHFYVHDMRRLFRTNYFDYTLNLFTSFGYFEKEQDDIATIRAVAKGLKAQGTFVLDFMNTKKVIRNLVERETIELENITFQVHRKAEQGFIVKEITVNDGGREIHFREKVQALTQEDFQKYFAAARLKIVDLRGNYDLEKFDEELSDRLIIIARKE